MPKKIVKKAAPKKAAKPQVKKEIGEVQEESPRKEIGEVTDYFTHVEAAAIKLTSSLNKGDKIRIKGHTTDFEQKVDSMQIHNKESEEAKKGDEIGLKVKDRVRPHDMVYKVD